ncbi:MAG TPA: enoyl-CoA hydratase-related protein [Pyrinomonadaceae bacterium]|nr:enoyl-CoA hydratase-related protein [Pyrinomonadaceae bacterium]
MDNSEIVLYLVQNGIVRITLNRPDKRNALNDAMIAALKGALRRADQDETVRAIIISGSGSDFCSGADLAALRKISRASVAENLEDASSLMELFLLIRAVRHPVIAAVRGRALAGGCGLALACDIVLAASSARFGFPEVKIGFVPAMVTAILRRNVSEKKAFELITLGDEISAGEAEGLGFINRAYDEERLEAEVDNLARRFGALSASAIAQSKRLLYQTDSLSFEDALSAGADVNAIARMSEDCRLGIERFLKKN